MDKYIKVSEFIEILDLFKVSTNCKSGSIEEIKADDKMYKRTIQISRNAKTIEQLLKFHEDNIENTIHNKEIDFMKSIVEKNKSTARRKVDMLSKHLRSKTK